MISHTDLCDCRVIHPERIAKARQEAFTAELTEDLSQIFKALADPTRLHILIALGQDEMCVCDLAALLGVSESAVSHQLRHLRTMRLVRNRRDGKVLYYRLADEHIAELIRIALEHVQEG